MIWKRSRARTERSRVPEMGTNQEAHRIASWPRLTRFYGISPLELAQTPNWMIRAYTEALPELEAQEQLMALQASDHPHVDTDSRKDTHRRLVDMAGYEIPEESGTKIDMTTAEGRRALHGLGIAVVTD